MTEGVGSMLIAYSDLFLVQCPRCSGRARIFTPNTQKSQDTYSYIGHDLKRLLCNKCGLSKDIRSKRNWQNLWVYEKKMFDSREGIDEYFGLPLYLQTKYKDRTLWFYNYDHLAEIEKYIREYINPSGLYTKNIENKLPSWIRLEKNKEDILNAIHKLKELV
jgi:hypothetical protein